VRVRIIFVVKNKGGYVPFYHQSLLAQLAESLLAGNRNFSSESEYSFSGLKGQTKVSKNGLHFYSSRATLVFSSHNPALIDFFLQNLFERGEFEVGTLQLVPESVERELPPLFRDELKCVCISPIVAVDPISNDFYAKKFITPDSDTFSDFLYESTMIRMEKSGRYTADQIASFYKFQVVPDKAYLQRIKEGEKKFARIYPIVENGNRYEVRGYTFPFALYSAPEVQQFVFECGLGYFTQKGFGMIDMTNADLTRRTEPYVLEKQAVSMNGYGKQNLNGH
jgi:CRISPR-associated endoribonuclease Cas6